MSLRERQLAYLEAMGLQAWQPRAPGMVAGGSSVEDPAIERPPETESPAEPATRSVEPAVSAREQSPAGESGSAVPPAAEAATAAVSRPAAAPIAARSLPSFPANDKGRVLVVCAAAEGEEGQGDPYAGELAELFDKMLQATRWPADIVAITDSVDSPRGAIMATGAEVIVAFGIGACRQLWDVGAMPGHLRGRSVPLFGAHAIATFHPASAQRDPSLKRPVWDDLKCAIEVLER